MSRFLNPDLPFFDEEGEPIALGTVYFGNANQDPRTNPKNPFVDSDLSNPASSTQKLTSGGKLKYPLFLEDSGYSLSVFDSNGVQVFTDSDFLGVGPRSSQNVNSIEELLNLNPASFSDDSVVTVISFYGEWQLSPSGAIGGGDFVFNPNTPKSEHNGGIIISPTVPWDDISTINFLNGVGETDPTGSGFYRF